MEKINDRFKKFVDNTPNAFCCVENIKKMLDKEGYIELYENKVWDDLKPNGKYYVTRNDSSLIAFKTVENKENLGFNIVASHSDSPGFLIKPNSEIYENGYLKLNIDGYGGMIKHTWLDRPLSIAGRVISRLNNTYKKQIINIDKDLLIIPSQAIHINNEVNTKNELKTQNDMLPIISLNKDTTLKEWIENYFSERYKSIFPIVGYDLYLYNRDKAKYIGMNNEFILAPRLDDLGCVYPSLESFINSENDNSINIFATFNNEEIGSLTMQGADSTFLIDVLTRIANSTNLDLLTALSNSVIISADNAHAIHPNASAKSDPTNKVYLNKGVVIKNHTNYTTDSVTSTLFKGICDNAEVPYQDFACNSNMRCGSTLGGISQRHVSIDSVDIGLPQLSMHSSNELMGSKDLLYMYKSLLEFYKSSFIKEGNIIKIKK